MKVFFTGITSLLCLLTAVLFLKLWFENMRDKFSFAFCIAAIITGIVGVLVWFLV